MIRLGLSGFSLILQFACESASDKGKGDAGSVSLA